MGESESDHGCCYYCRIVFVIWVAMWSGLESPESYFSPEATATMNKYFLDEYVNGNLYNFTSKLEVMAVMNAEMDRVIGPTHAISPQFTLSLTPEVEHGLKEMSGIPTDYTLANIQILRKGMLGAYTKTTNSCHRDFSYGLLLNSKRLLVTADPEGSCMETCEAAPAFMNPMTERNNCHTCEMKCAPLVFNPYASFHKFGTGSHSIVIDFRPNTFIEKVKTTMFGAFLRMGHFLVSPLPLDNVKSNRIKGGRVFGRNRIRFSGLVDWITA